MTQQASGMMIQADAAFFIASWGIAGKDEKTLYPAITYRFAQHLKNAERQDKEFWRSFKMLAEVFAYEGLLPKRIAKELMDQAFDGKIPLHVGRKMKELLEISQKIHLDKVRQSNAIGATSVPYDEQAEVGTSEASTEPVQDNVVHLPITEAGVPVDATPAVPIEEVKTPEVEAPAAKPAKKGFFG